MKIINLTNTHSNIYTSNVYLVTGTWNAINDVNTLIDVGRDDSIIEKINNASTGVGKKRIEHVILTHSHYDHSSLLPRIKHEYNSLVYANSAVLGGVDVILKGGEIIKIGDRHFEVIHTPGHSADSICLYCEEERVLFSGDTPIIIINSDGTYEETFIEILSKIAMKNIDTIYFGHGNPLSYDCKKALQNSLNNIKKSKIIKN